MTRVLVAERDATTAEFVVEALGAEGYAVDVVTSLADAVARAARDAFEVVLAGGFGPGSHLFPSEEDRARLRQLANGTRVVVATGRAWAERLSAADLGVAAILKKPYDLDDLLNAVRGG